MRYITAKKISEILEGLDPQIISRSMGLPVRKKRVTKTNIWFWDVTGTENTYRVKLKAVPKNKSIKRVQSSDVLISCTCPYWRWQGPEHWAKVEGYLYGKPRGTASKPVIKDPQGTHRVCKHVLTVLGRIQRMDLPSSRKVATAYLAGRST